MTAERSRPPCGSTLFEAGDFYPSSQPLPLRKGLIAASAAALLGAALATMAPQARAQGASTQAKQAASSDVVVYASDIPGKGLSEFRSVKDPAAAGGTYVVTPNTGGELDPPPENDPHVTLTARVQPGVPYRLWIHMKVGKPKGKSEANLIFAQFSDAVDAAGKEKLAPRTGSYLKLRGAAGEGWKWVTSDAKSEPVRFKTGGEVTIRLQAGMEGVGFDQVLLSPARYLEKAPPEAVVGK